MDELPQLKIERKPGYYFQSPVEYFKYILGDLEITDRIPINGYNELPLLWRFGQYNTWLLTREFMKQGAKFLSVQFLNMDRVNNSSRLKQSADLFDIGLDPENPTYNIHPLFRIETDITEEDRYKSDGYDYIWIVFTGKYMYLIKNATILTVNNLEEPQAPYVVGSD